MFLAEVSVDSLAGVVSSAGAVFTGLIGWLGQGIDFVVGRPIMLFPMFLGIGYGVIKFGTARLRGN